MQIIICDICSNKVPAQFKNQHHIRPQAAGGGPEDEVALCSGCHQNLHALEKLIKKSKLGEAKDVAGVFYSTNQKAAEKCVAYATESARWMTAKDEGAPEASNKAHEEAEIVIAVPFIVKEYLQSMSKLVKNPVTGRSLGLSGMIRQLVLESVFRQNPQLRDIITKSSQKAIVEGEAKRKAGPTPRRNVMN